MTILQNHQVNELTNQNKKRKTNAAEFVEMEDYHHFNNIRLYLVDLAEKYPFCITRTGKKDVLKCSCNSVFYFPQVACCVAAYLMEFGLKDKKAKQMIIIEWMRNIKMADDIVGNQPYSLPFFPSLISKIFSEMKGLLVMIYHSLSCIVIKYARQQS
jgi:hypothetical protein